MSSETCTNPGPEILSSDSRTARSIPMRSISLIVNTRTPASRRSRRSPSSRSRVPTSATRLRIDRGQRPRLALEARPGEAERRGERHPVDVPARARLGRVDVRVRVDPENAPRAVHRREPSERAQRDRVIPAEHERHRAASSHLGDASSDQLTRVVDLGEEARAFVPESGRLGDRGLDVPLVVHRVAEADESLLETRVPDRRGPHVDAASSLPEVERRADDRDLSLRAHAQNLTAAAATLVAAAR